MTGIFPASNRSPDPRAGVLVLCHQPTVRLRLREIFQGCALELYEAGSWREGAPRLMRHRPQVVICEAALPDAGWKDVLVHTASLQDPPRLIVFASHADDSLWSEVLNLGGYDVLSHPLVGDEVVRAVGLAWMNWVSERERRQKVGTRIR